MYEELKDSSRLLLEADLWPVQGDRFQPTGFADLGAATYRLADGTSKLLVESSQSMANRLELTIIQSNGEIIPELEGISYVRAILKGETDAVTTSLIEAHRINSPYIVAGLKDRIIKETGYKKGDLINWGKVAEALFSLDINTLIHGVFLANIEDGRIKLPRALSAFIEAEDITEAVSGGVKNNPLDPTGTIRSKLLDKDVYGNVPYSRIEYAAGKITAYFNLDLEQIRGYGLSDKAIDLLVSLSLLKIRRLLKVGLRLRTACDFQVRDICITCPKGYAIPDEKSLLKSTQTGISECRNLFADPPVTEVECNVVVKKKSSGEE